MVLFQPLAPQSLSGEPDQPVAQVPLTPEVSDRVAVKVALPVVVSLAQVFSKKRARKKMLLNRRGLQKTKRTASYGCKC